MLWLRKARVLSDRELVQSMARHPRRIKGSVWAASGGLPGAGPAAVTPVAHSPSRLGTNAL
ncbi:hypothetical protein MHIB_38330 [Mycolicibacter hiberniae]|uniref:Uncharacterized protein n=1 Tax=Mycolicibacter hiberniae TaxID=29314 RepID=A0A7I7X851_9MYCO|nr:hypothetical protein AWC09_15895 [Mycolicibacter hiberniae]BBZ25415.1 hypothetical protein MHIB_38330 [Mycolicibacter hiberniae]